MQATGRRDDHERQKNRLKDGNATEHGHSHGGTTCVFDMRGPGARSAHDQGMDNTTICLPVFRSDISILLRSWGDVSRARRA